MKKFLVLILMFSSVSLLAQEKENEKNEEMCIELESVEVTGVRADDNTPVTEKTVTSEEIKENYQGEEMSFILEETPSVTTSTDGGHYQGYTYFRLRGIDQTRINMTLNGVPLNEPEDQGVYFSNYPGFANNIASMQIQRGVGTSSNGVASYAGSINFESPTGLNQSSSVELGYGSFNTRRINGNVSTGLIDGTKNAMYMNFSSYQTDGYKYNSGGMGHSFFVSGGHYGDKHVIKFTGFTGRAFNQMAWFAVSEDDIENDPRTNYNTPREDDDFMQSFAQLNHTARLGKNGAISTTAYYNRLDGNWDLDLLPLGGGNDVLNYQLASNFYGLMSNIRYVSESITLNVGVHGNMYNRDHAMAALPDIDDRLYENTGYKNEASTFAKFNYKIGKVNIFADAQYRYVYFRYKGDVAMAPIDWNFFNPKGGVMVNINKNNNLYASIGKANREPTRTDLFGGEDNLITLTEIKPEEVIDIEAGYNYKSKDLNVHANIYYMDFENEITLIGALGSNGLPLMANVQNSFRSGIELDAQYRVKDYLILDNNTSYSYNRINDGGVKFQPLYTPSWIVNQTVTYKPCKYFSIGLNGRYQSESFIDFENEYVAPAFFLLNTNATFTYKAASLKVQVNNLTNQEYFTNGYVISGTRYFFVNAPTNFYLTLVFNF